MSGESGYKAFSRLLDVEELSVESINNCLAGKIDTSQLDYFIIDESNISKDYYTDKNDQNKSKKLDRIKNSKNEIVPGYASNNAIVVSNSKIQILEHKLYSTKEDDYKSKTVVAIDILKKHLNTARVLLDRFYDNYPILDLLLDQYKSLNRSFTVRVSHLNRLIKHKHELLPLKDIEYTDSHNFKLDKIKLKKEVYTKVNLQLSWSRVYLSNDDLKSTQLSDYNKSISIIKAELKSSKGELVFNEPMYLFVPEEVNALTVYDLYRSYFYRWSIEQVFKFMKEVMEVDKFRIQDFKQIKKLTSICFLVGAYFYEIGKVDVDEDFMIKINKLGENPNPHKPTLYYSRVGLMKVRYKMEVDIFFEREKISIEEQRKMMRIANGGV